MDKVHVHDVGYKYDPTRSRISRYRSLDFHLYSLYTLKTLFVIRRLVRDLEPDILHLHTLYFPSCYGADIGICPLVVTPWNGDVLWMHKRNWYQRLLSLRALKTADVVTVNSDEMANKCQTLGVPRERLRKIVIGAGNLRSFSPDTESHQLRRDLKLGDSPVVLSTRSWINPYNIHVLVEAIPIVLERVPAARFIFNWPAAQERYQKHINDLIISRGLSAKVRIVGPVEHSELPPFYSLADVFVSVSSLDSTPASLLEAMASGTLPIVGELPPLKEWITHGWNGYVVPLGDSQALARAIVMALTRPRERKIFADRNLQIVRQKADYEQEVSKMEELYWSLLAKTSRARMVQAKGSRDGNF